MMRSTINLLIYSCINTPPSDIFVSTEENGGREAYGGGLLKFQHIKVQGNHFGS